MPPACELAFALQAGQVVQNLLSHPSIRFDDSDACLALLAAQCAIFLF